MRYKLIVSLSVFLGTFCAVKAATWETMFAYNAVTQIAVAQDKVYALSGNTIFSVNKHSDQIEIYNSASGLHGNSIGCIYYDQGTDILLLGYTNGKIDLLSNGVIEYVSGLYTKDMTANKYINNITVYKGRAYLSMDFGIVTFNLKKHELVDTYYIGEGSSEVKVKDILFIGDSIY